MNETAFGATELDRFRATFFEECAELIADMEARLAGVATHVVDAEELNAIFRAVHSIKAGAGAFGLKRLVGFSHGFEALLDCLRSGRLVQDDRISHVLVRGGDVLAALVDEAQGRGELAANFGSDVSEEMLALLDDGSCAAQDAVRPTPAVAQPDTVAAPGLTHYRIRFRPLAELFRHANEPLLLIREMKRIGTLATCCDLSALPGLDALEPEDAYLAWTFDLITDKSLATVTEIFEFVDTDCTLQIEAIADAAASPNAAAASAADAASGKAPPPPASHPDKAKGAAGHGASVHAVPTEPAAGQTAPTQASPGRLPAAGRAGSASASIRVDLARIDRLVNTVGELVITQAMLAQQLTDEGNIAARILRGHEDLAQLTRELQECVMAIRMQPVKSVFQRMPRLVREIAAKLGKEVELVMRGEQTEVDKTVIEELADPLTHMIRNAIDHGIEDPATRAAEGKPAIGRIELSAAHVGSNILIHVADDGAGIQREKLLKKAIERGIVPPNVDFEDSEIDELIFAPGFSTAQVVTDVSGRGVGMDVVRRNVNALGGRILVQSTPGRGTRFTLIIPLTLAVLDGMVVAVGDEKYILPLTSIVESYRPDRHTVCTLAGGGQVAAVRGEYVRLVYLWKVFSVPNAVTEPWNGLVVLVETASGGKIGVVVDELIGQQQVVIKSLQENFDPVAGISGATILGNGRVALIIDIEQLPTLGDRRRRQWLDEAAANREQRETASLPLALTG
ncbi:MAG: chemotaxis protein CheA [Ancalomicrobiaceae bacterium]|nr:chemotaxis protein CheA [Ancalomicrobiaceae bacterium]